MTHKTKPTRVKIESALIGIDTDPKLRVMLTGDPSEPTPESMSFKLAMIGLRELRAWLDDGRAANMGLCATVIQFGDEASVKVIPAAIIGPILRQRGLSEEADHIQKLDRTRMLVDGVATVYVVPEHEPPTGMIVGAAVSSMTVEHIRRIKDLGSANWTPGGSS